MYQARTRPRRDYVVQYAATAGVGFALFFVVSYLGSFYLGAFTFPRALSFPAAEWPGNAGSVVDPTFAVGVHYFGDYLATWLQSAAPSPYLTGSAVFPSNYPPVVHLLLRPLTWMPYFMSLGLFLLVSAAAILVPMAFALRGRRPGQRVVLLVTGVVLTGPFLSVLDRGNAQGIVTGLMIAAALLLASRRDLWAAIFIGLAAALKGYPIVFVAVLLHRRKWLESAVAAGVFLGVTAMALLTFEGGFGANVRALWDATSPFRNVQVGAETVDPAFNYSLYSLLQVLDNERIGLAGSALHHYAIAAVVVVVVTVLVALAPRLSLSERLLALCVLIVLVPTITGSYVLTVFFAPIAVIALGGSRTSRLPTFYVVVVAVLMVPKGIPLETGWSSVASVVNPLLTLVLLGGLALSAARHAATRIERFPEPDSEGRVGALRGVGEGTGDVPVKP